jgi:uncharacterized membrane protein YGL010W
MKTLAEQMGFYQRYHTKMNNKVTHMVGIPLIVFSILIPLGWVQILIPNLLHTNLAWTILTLTVIYYLFLDLFMALGMALIFIVLTLIASIFYQGGPSLLGLYVFLGCFVTGWILQLIGHMFEKRKPAFMANLFQLIIGPIFILAEVVFILGYRRNLHQKVMDIASKPEL